MVISPFYASANRACSLLYSYIKEQKFGTWLLPVNVCPVVPFTFYLAKIPFKFVDINPKTLCVDEDYCVNLINKSISQYIGVVYVRTYGFICDTTHFFKRLKTLSADIKIIDDRCLCLPDLSPNLFGADMVLYSTGYGKQIDLGTGGLAFYSVPTSFNIDRSLEYVGTDVERFYKEAFKCGKKITIPPQGWLKLEENKLSDNYFEYIQNNIHKRVEYRQGLNNIYMKRLPKFIQLPEEFQTWRFNIRVPVSFKKAILEKLFNNNLFASNHYHSVNLLFDNEYFPNSNCLYDEVINLFNDYHYTEEQAQKTCLIINDFFK